VLIIKLKQGDSLFVVYVGQINNTSTRGGEHMAVKVFIKRKVVAEELAPKLDALLRKMRVLTLNRKGYISGETFNQIDQPGVSLVISSWQTLDDWREWTLSKERCELQEQIDKLLGQPTTYEIFENV
jgi:heme-degrading monooxygenase HmoA